MTFVGHEEPWREWHDALAGPRLHHGWLLAGKRGIGKAAFALQAARELVAEEGTPQPAGAHPDIIVLEPLPASAEDERKREEGKPYQLKRNITVDQVRAMQQRLTTRPTLGRRRAIIVDAADDLETSAANALLKSLEEPPEGSYFLLVAHRLGRLLPTIRSRCRLLQFPGLAAADLDAILSRAAPQADTATRDAAIAAAGGSPGAALDFVELDLGRMHAVMETLTEKGDRDLALRGKLSEALGARPDRKRQLASVELARAVVARRMATTDRSAIPALTHAHAELVSLAAQAPTYNYDPGLLMMEIGGLLASLALPREAAHG